jgi:hypothetical protein
MKIRTDGTSCPSEGPACPSATRCAVHGQAGHAQVLPSYEPGNASPLPTLDSPRLLGRTAVDAALGEAHLPNWRAGPPVERLR